MAGLVSALGTTIRVLSNIQEHGLAKGVLESLEDSKVRLLRADGSMMRMLNSYVVEPIAVVSDDLKDLEELDGLLGLHMDLFVSYYMQAFDVMYHGMNINYKAAIDTLATDNGGLERGLLKGLQVSTESEDFDYLADMIQGANLAVERHGGVNSTPVDSVITAGVKPQAAPGDSSKGKLHGAAKAKADLEASRYSREELKKIKPSQRRYYLNRDIIKTKTGLDDRGKDLLIPNAIQRDIVITVTTPMPEPGSDGVYHTMTIEIPVKVKLAVIFTGVKTIASMIETHGQESSFTSRLDEYRAGSISVADFLLATDLIKKYKKHRMKDNDGLVAITEARTLSANSKAITNGFGGFEKYYNMYLVSQDVKASLDKVMHKNLYKTNAKDEFLEATGGLSLTVADTDYERMIMQYKDVRGKTDLTFKKAVKKDKGDGDYSEIIKALMANKAPAF